MFSKRDKALLAIGGVAIVTPFTYGMTEAQGWQGLLLAAVVLLAMGGGIYCLFTGHHPTGSQD